MSHPKWDRKLHNETVWVAIIRIALLAFVIWLMGGNQ